MLLLIFIVKRGVIVYAKNEQKSVKKARHFKNREKRQNFGLFAVFFLGRKILRGFFLNIAGVLRDFDHQDKNAGL